MADLPMRSGGIPARRFSCGPRSLANSAVADSVAQSLLASRTLRDGAWSHDLADSLRRTNFSDRLRFIGHLLLIG